ncbi:hypothetical protein, partial [Propionivibrio sp.]|uniref:hypothetical protein n=1 Tax=Propionivibrio sp. TaxID=2212460 RepID=UPI003BF146BA
MPMSTLEQLVREVECRLWIFLLPTATFLGSCQSKLKVSNGEKPIPAMQRKRSVVVNPGIEAVAPKRTLPTLVQFGYSTIARTGKLSFDGGNCFFA